MTLALPNACKNCGESDGFKWFADVIVTAPVQNGRLNTHDVKPVFILGCEICSETLRIVDATEIAAELNAMNETRETIQP